MKKVLVLLACLLCAASLVGCSSKGATKLRLKTNGKSIYNGSMELSCTEHRGYEATTFVEDNYNIEYYLCETMDGCSHNVLGVIIDDMSSFKEGKYYTGYLGTLIVYYYPYKGSYIECYATLYTLEQYPVNQILDIMYKQASALALSKDTTEVEFEDVLTVNVSGYDFKVRSTELVIPGLLKVSPDDGSITATSSIVIGTNVCGYYATAAYEYYQYNGVIVQVPVGTSIESLVTFQ